MIRYTPEALAHLDDVPGRGPVGRGRAHSISPDEVEADVRDHVAAALEHADQPVTERAVADVLERLGPAGAVGGRQPPVDLEVPGRHLEAGRPPGGREQVKALPGEAYQAGRGLVGRVRGLPHGWRLAYVAFGLFALGMIAFPLFPAFLIASYFAARADVALARERGEALGARRWLVYPPMVILSVALFVALAFWPVDCRASTPAHMPRAVKPDVAAAVGVSREDRRAGRRRSTRSSGPCPRGGSSCRWSPCGSRGCRPPCSRRSAARFRRADALIVLLLSATVFVLWLSKADAAWRALNVLWDA